MVTTTLKMRRVQVRSLVRKLRSRVLPSEAKNNDDDASRVCCSNPETQLLCPVLLLFSRSVLSDSSVAPWTVACQAPLSIGFPRQGHWSGLPFPSPGDRPDPEMEPASPASAGGFFTTEPPRKPCVQFYRTGNGGSETLSNVPEATQPKMAESRTISFPLKVPKLSGTRDQFCGRQIFPSTREGRVIQVHYIYCVCVFFVIITSAPPQLIRHY